MATQENGQLVNILSNLPAAVNISSSTNTTPVVITTSTPHGMTNGDYVTIQDHHTNLNCNGTLMQATVLSATTFSLPTFVTPIAAGGATGTVQSLALGPTFAIPADGVDNLDAASVNVPMEALADRTAFLGATTGALKVVGISTFSRDTDVSTSWDSFTPGTLVDNSWNDLASGTVWQVPDVAQGDTLVITFDFNSDIVFSAGGVGNLMKYSLFASPTPPGAAQVYSQIGATQKIVTNDFANSSIQIIPVHISGVYAWNTQSGTLFLRLRGNPTTHANLSTWSLDGAFMVTVTIYRPTFKAQ